MNPNVTLLTWGKLYSYIMKNSDLPVSINVFPTNTLGEMHHPVHFTILTYYEKSKSIGLWFKIDTHPGDYLWVPRLYPNERVKGFIHDMLYDYFYFVPNPTPSAPLSKMKLSTKVPSTPKTLKKGCKPLDILPTIYQKPPFAQKQNYDLYQKIQQDSADYPGKSKRILIVCGLEGYIQKKTTDWIKKLYPNHKLEIINTGETGQHYFMLGHSEWPEHIQGRFDMIVLEFCPINIFTYNNLHILYEKLRKRGFVLFLSRYDRLLVKRSFKKFIDRELKDNRKKTLTFETLKS